MRDDISLSGVVWPVLKRLAGGQPWSEGDAL